MYSIVTANRDILGYLGIILGRRYYRITRTPLQGTAVLRIADCTVPLANYGKYCIQMSVDPELKYVERNQTFTVSEFSQLPDDLISHYTKIGVKVVDNS